ncbi:MAG: polysulfide reductase NrfD [Planctomycetes bacterium]|nr:polysulfide reductase NrfD [Planctomycetota bacterium]
MANSHAPSLTIVDPVLEGKQDLATVGSAIGDYVLEGEKQPVQWWFFFAIGFVMLTVLLYAVTYLFYMGVGIWGLNVPVAWGFAIINFVWWIGIGHAGTLISAILLLLHQKWRTSINRFSETMTIFAVMCAGLFPLLHMGRPWFFYWLYPFPNIAGVWPQFRSPLVWDVFAVTTYFTVSLVFWFIGMVPDLAYLRDNAKTKLQRVIYGIFAMGWRGSAIHWRRHEKVYLMLAGLGTPLVFSVHTVVSFDFAVSIVPLWHATIFPPFFVAVFCNFVVPQLLWSRKIRHNDLWLMIISIFVLIGMWFERYVIVITLSREYIPSMWGRYSPTIWDWATMVGSMGLFLTLFMLFLRFLPMISMTEMRELLPKKEGGADGHSILENAP